MTAGTNRNPERHPKEQPICLSHKTERNLPSLADGTKVVLVSCANIGKLHKSRSYTKTAPGLREGFLITIGDGEVYKSLNCWKTLLCTLGSEGVKKRDVAIVRGGGVGGDLVGFLSACYMRGICLVHLPTTLLSQTDSSIGSKTGLNTSFGKNSVGAFHSASAIAVDIGSLRSLPPKEWSGGLCEVIKVGMCGSVTFFRRLESEVHEVLSRQTSPSLSLINQACLTKSFVAAKDPGEKGMRSVLNFGHTFGHAIELSLSYTKWSHGEAVGCGMAIAVGVSFALGFTSPNTRNRLLRLLSACGLPTSLPGDLDASDLATNMCSDKKNLNQAVSVVLLRGVADPVIVPIETNRLTEVTRLCCRC